MLNKVVSATISLALLSVSSLAFAGHTNKFYVGASYDYNVFTTNKNKEYSYLVSPVTFVKRQLNGVTLKGGYRWTKFGVEAGHSFMQRVTYTAPNGSLKQSNYNNYLDGYYYHPLLSNLELKAMVGVGVLHTTMDTNVSSTTDFGFMYLTTTSIRHETMNSVKPRAGLGFQYNFAKDWSADVMYKYQSGNSLYSNMNTVSVGVNVYI